MKEPAYWNHNVAYYPWIKKETEGCKCILDVGCGDGSLLSYLDDGSHELYGIDIDKFAIDRAKEANGSEKISYEIASFDEIDENEKYDAIVFVASIHHMNMSDTLQKAKKMLSTGGKLVIVGLAKPSTLTDRIIEAGRVLPSRIITKKHQKNASENEFKPVVSFDMPNLNDVRKIISEEIPYASWRQALHYRYLLTWIKE